MEIGYIRCSTNKQDLEVQREKMRNAGVERIFEDYAESGSKLGRTGMEKALAALRSGDRLTVTKVDRLSRSLRDLVNTVGDFNERSIAFRCLDQAFDTSTPEGRLMFGMLASFAEFEREMIRSRTKDAMAIARKKGKLQGRKPKLSDAQQQGLFKQYVSGEYTVTELADSYKISRAAVYRVIDRMKRKDKADEAA